MVDSSPSSPSVPVSRRLRPGDAARGDDGLRLELPLALRGVKPGLVLRAVTIILAIAKECCKDVYKRCWVKDRVTFVACRRLKRKERQCSTHLTW